MEVVTAAPNGSGVPPFHNHDVHEWSRIDSLTGVLERARLETDHWTANTSNSSHNYGKVVDTRARSDADGAIRQQARRQLEVFQSSVPGGRLQVIKSHTVSSSRWTSKSPTTGEHNKEISHFTDLELPLNPLDLSSQKSKATVGRSVGRRPPSRPRGRDDSSTSNHQPFAPATTNLNRISRLCNQVHENAVKQTFGKYYHKPPIHERESGDGVEINEIESTNGHANLIRTKSTSSEDVHLTSENDKHKKSVEDLEDLEQLQNWRRSSKIRRSLQFPTAQSKTAKPLDLPENTGSVRKIKEDLETGRRLNTALRGNSVDLDALDQILQSIATPNGLEQPDEQISVKKQKRHSFVTVESLQEVRGRLRRTSSPTDVCKKEEDADDGIDTEEKSTDEMPAVDGLTTQSSRVRSYVYGMEALINKKPVLGTGSLESRTSRQLNGTCGNRNEDWYNRRKSYGFEQVHNHHEPMAKNKSLMESSTDSGICRSTEIVLVPAANKNNSQLLNGDTDNIRIGKYANNIDVSVGNVKRYASIFENKNESKLHDYHFVKKSPIKDYEGTKITIPILPEKQFDYKNDSNTDTEIKRHSIAVDETKYVIPPLNNYKRISLAINDKPHDTYLNDCIEDEFHGRRQKKVEFCKTEVHFAVDSGRVNIVATDEKPPPTSNFRRRRRNSGTLYNNLLGESNKNELPMLHFGDAENEEPDSDPYAKPSEVFAENTVTVSTNQSSHENTILDDEKENLETPKGILKNKPVKPKPYLLGDDPFCTQSDEREIWGVKLKPVQASSDPPMWKSTVTLKNTLYDKKNDELPTWDKPTLENPDEIPVKESARHSEQFDNIRIISSQPNTKRSSWAVTNKVKQLEEVQVRGYSTRVNIGGGNATVIEDDKRQILNKGLVVRIDNSHTICSKTTTDKDNATTTTKITIDLSPSPTDQDLNEKPNFQPVRLPRASLSNFKSTSLVLNTFKTERIDHPESTIPQQLEALKRLYDDWHSDNEADKEVQLLMNGTDQEPSKEFDVNSSVVSGSWSKMRAFRNMQQQKAKSNAELNSHARLEKGSVNAPQTNIELTKAPVTATISKESPKLSEMYNRKIKLNRTPTSPVVLRKAYCDSKKQELRTAYNTSKLSSPSLVGQNVIKVDLDKKCTLSWKRENVKSWESTVQKPRSPSPIVKRQANASPSRRSCESPKDAQPEVYDAGQTNRSVLRNPKKSEMAYFGVKMSPSPKPPRKSAETKAGYETKSPIYENVDSLKNGKQKVVRREFDSSILDELTKAADQILQAVNGYAEEAERQSWEEEKKTAKKLDTISETKSWKQKTVTKHSCSETRAVSTRAKLKHTSSTSSIESMADARKPARRPAESEQQKKKSGSDTSSSRAAATKARRLQRASSREALLQSHGSSSEDLPVTLEVPVRKPRLVRKAKTPQTSTVESRTKRSPEKSKHEERVPIGALPTIRHKTAVSTIRSTAEKAQIRERNSRLRNEDAKKRATSRNETKTSVVRNDKNRNVSSREPINHRISTANIKKCYKADALVKS